MVERQDKEGDLLKILVSPVSVLLAISALMILIRLLANSLSTPRLQNTEVIEWVDWRGRLRRIVIHRRVD
ncbi:MAG: hypothetical protein LM558_03155 [Thermosphaera sp.]|nr:hypothetical protein [Thermosphaera sp.]